MLTHVRMRLSRVRAIPYANVFSVLGKIATDKTIRKTIDVLFIAYFIRRFPYKGRYGRKCTVKRH